MPPIDAQAKILAALQSSDLSFAELVETLSHARVKPLQIRLLLSAMVRDGQV
jgi:hypothetical protein